MLNVIMLSVIVPIASLGYLAFSKKLNTFWKFIKWHVDIMAHHHFNKQSFYIKFDVV